MTSLTCNQVTDIVSSQKHKYFSSGEISGKSYGNHIVIRYVSANRNSWSPIFYGQVENCTNGVKITGNFRASTITKFFLRIFQGFAIFLAMGILFAAFVNADVSMLVLLIFPLLVYLMMLGVKKFGVTIGERDKADILRFIEETLMATPNISQEEPPSI